MDRREQAESAWRPLAGDACRRSWRSTVVRDGPGRHAPRASLWTLSQVIAAALAVHPLGLVDRRDVERLLRGTRPFRRGAAYAPVPYGSERYYDDNAWLGLDLVQAADALGSPSLQDEARVVLRFLVSGTDESGGVLWVDRGPRSRHTCSTGPAAELAFRLALAGDDTRPFGEAAVRFLQRELQREDGLYADHVREDHTVEPTLWSYNQGTPVGAGALLFRLGGDEDVLADARRTADAALAHFAAEDRLWRQPPVFNAVFFRNLLLLDGIGGYPPVGPALDAYLDRAWTEGRHPATGWFTEGGIGRYEQGGSIDQSAFVQLFALAAWPRERRALIS
jgi:hypothetical protein